MENVSIFEVAERTAELLRELLNVWEKSVRATHLFLSDSEIAQIKEYVPQGLASVVKLIVVEKEAGTPIAFMGIAKGNLEMLFIALEECGKGLGRKLMQHGMDNYGVKTVEVNEQNPQARGFYEHMGFKVYKRSELDGQGRPYPILYMRF